MPKVSKLQSTKLKPVEPVEDRSGFYCVRCGKKYKQQTANFSKSQSTLYKGNFGYMPVCRNCVDDMYSHYKVAIGNERDACRRVCEKLDIYWSESLWHSVKSDPHFDRRIRTYIGKANGLQCLGKTYDDTLDEESGLSPTKIIAEQTGEDCDPVLSEVSIVSDELREFWGSGYPAEAYYELQNLYDDWMRDDDGNEVSYPKEQLRLIKQLCRLERRIANNDRPGSKINDDVAAYNSLLGSANLKPSQKIADAKNAASDILTFGTGIKIWEDDKPIPEPDPQFADVDGIVRYISVWFLGHLCKMLGIKNSYSRMYEQEISRLRVDRPEYDEEDDEDFFQNAFESSGDRDE